MELAPKEYKKTPCRGIDLDRFVLSDDDLESQVRRLHDLGRKFEACKQRAGKSQVAWRTWNQTPESGVSTLLPSTTFHNMTSTHIRQFVMAAGNPKSTQHPLNVREIIELRIATRKIIGTALEESSIATYRNAWSQFRVWTSTILQEPVSEETACMFVVWRTKFPLVKNRKPLSIQAAHHYGRCIKAVAHRAGLQWEGKDLTNLLSSLAKDGALVALYQAPIIKIRTFWRKWYRLIVRPTLSWTLYVGVLTASRIDDLLVLRTTDVKFRLLRSIMLWRPEGNIDLPRRNLKADRDGTGHCTIIDDADESRGLAFQEWARQVTTKFLFEEVSHQEILDALRMIRGDLRAQSMKASACDALGNANLLSERQLSYFGKHAAEGGMGKNTRKYMRPETLAIIRRTHEASRYLSSLSIGQLNEDSDEETRWTEQIEPTPDDTDEEEADDTTRAGIIEENLDDLWPEARETSQALQNSPLPNEEQPRQRSQSAPTLSRNPSPERSRFGRTLRKTVFFSF